MEGVIVREIEPVNLKDTRGGTYEWAKGIEARQLTICKAVYARAVYGNHFHLGEDPSKDPERVLVISGRLKLVTCNGRETIEQIVGRFEEILINPLIAHAYISQEETVFLEHRPTVYNPKNNDTYSFDKYVKALAGRKLEVNEEAVERFLQHLK